MDVDFDLQEFSRYVKGDLTKIWEKLNALDTSMSLLKK